MSDRALRELHRAAETATPYGDVDAAIRSARARRRRNGVLGLVVATLLVAAGVAIASQPPPLPASLPTPAQPLIDQQSDPSLQVVTVSDTAAPARLLYRTCGSTSCTVGITDNTNQHLRVPSLLSEDLAIAGLDDVTLSPDGEWVGLPHEDGAFTVVQAFNLGLAVEVPPGPPGSRWAPYFWTAADDQHLVLAQWTGTRVTGYAVVHVGDTSRPWLQVTTVAAPGGESLVPQSPAGATDGRIDVAAVPRLGNRERPQQAVDERTLSLRDGAPVQASRRTRDLSTCLRANESVLGPEGVPMSFGLPAEGPDEATEVTVVFTVVDGRPVPSGVVAGGCPSGDDDATRTRYDLPMTTADSTWHLLGPVTPTTALLNRHAYGAPVNDLVLVGADSPPVVVGTVPRGTTVVAPGMTGGFFE